MQLLKNVATQKLTKKVEPKMREPEPTIVASLKSGYRKSDKSLMYIRKRALSLDDMIKATDAKRVRMIDDRRKTLERLKRAEQRKSVAKKLLEEGLGMMTVSMATGTR